MSDTSEAVQWHESHVLQYLSGDFWQGMWGLMRTSVEWRKAVNLGQREQKLITASRHDDELRRHKA